MNARAIVKKTLAAAALSASLLGLGAGVAEARPIENTVGGNCGASGGKWESFWGAGSYLGGTCTYGNTRFHFDSHDINYQEERRIKGKWTVVWNGN